MPVDRQFSLSCSTREREARTLLAQARVRADTAILGLIFPAVAKLSQLVGRNSGFGDFERVDGAYATPGRPRVVAPNGAIPNREGQPLWPPTRPAARNHWINRLPLAVVRKRSLLTSATDVHQFGGGSAPGIREGEPAGDAFKRCAEICPGAVTLKCFAWAMPGGRFQQAFWRRVSPAIGSGSLNYCLHSYAPT
jgi:hypothetical protein